MGWNSFQVSSEIGNREGFKKGYKPEILSRLSVLPLIYKVCFDDLDRMNVHLRYIGFITNK
jgi:hypothetical protein